MVTTAQTSSKSGFQSPALKPRTVKLSRKRTGVPLKSSQQSKDRVVLAPLDLNCSERLSPSVGGVVAQHKATDTALQSVKALVEFGQQTVTAKAFQADGVSTKFCQHQATGKALRTLELKVRHWIRTPSTPHHRSRLERLF